MDTQSTPVDELIRMAAELLQKGEKQAARDILRSVVKAEPKNVAVWEALAAASNNAAEEIYCLTHVLRLLPEHAGAKQRLALLKTPAAQDARRRRSRPLFVAGLVVVLLVCVGLFAVGVARAGLFPSGLASVNQAATQVSSCQDLVDRARKSSDTSCEKLGPNGVCYANLTLHAGLVPGATGHFTERGDQIPVAQLRSLAAAPLDLQSGEWGIAIFRLIANLPRSLPGELVTLFVFGNTTLTKDGPTLESFYFHSQLGSFVCEQVPFDGILVTVPDGAGVRLHVNGSVLTLLGNAALRAGANDHMEISLFSGSGSVGAAGQEVYFGAGQKVSVPLGGSSGEDASGPPSPPVYLSSAELAASCAMTGRFCSPNEIVLVPPSQAILNVQAAVGPQIALVNTPTASGAATTIAPSTDTPAPEITASFTSSPTRTRVPVRTATSIRAQAPNQPAPSATTKPSNPTQAPTATQVPPTATFTATPTHTPVPSATEVPPTQTPVVVRCGDFQADKLVPNDNSLVVHIFNRSGVNVAFNQLTVRWGDSTSGSQTRLHQVFWGGDQIWSGPPDGSSPSSFPADFGWSSAPQLPANTDITLRLHFVPWEPASASLTIRLDNDCQIEAQK